MKTTSYLATPIIILLVLFQLPSHGAGQPVPGDYNGNGAVSHSDYTILGDSFGNVGFGLQGDGNEDGIVNALDLQFYSLHYGQPEPVAGDPSFLALSVTSTSTPSGDTLWTFVFSDVKSSLAGHLNISSSSTPILTLEGGPSFADDNVSPLGVPGHQSDGTIGEGILIVDSHHAFAGLGTTLEALPAASPLPTTRTFLQVVTAGTGPNTLTYAGGYGYQGQDYVLNGVATAAPPPSHGDFDNDGDVTGRDFLAWQRHPELGNLGDWQNAYGAGAMFRHGDVPARFAVPEPHGLVMMLGVLAMTRALSRTRD